MAVNFRITDEVSLGQGPETQKYNDSIAAISALKTIARENRRTPPEEQRQLARYDGCGSRASAFRDTEGETQAWWRRAKQGGPQAGIWDTLGTEN